jgi:AcrR family transcriptional regulator
MNSGAIGVGMETRHSGSTVPDTAGRIMAVMADVALEKGLDALSMRDVAKRVGISLAALQYHFSSKDALIAAFVNTMLAGYRNEVGAICSDSDTVDEFRNIVRFAVRQNLDVRTGKIFAMLEARAIHDDATAVVLDGFMRVYLETVCDVLRRRHPHLPLKDAQLAALQVVAMIEGLCSVRSGAQALGFSAEDLCDSVATMAEATAATAAAAAGATRS